MTLAECLLRTFEGVYRKSQKCIRLFVDFVQWSQRHPSEQQCLAFQRAWRDIARYIQYLANQGSSDIQRTRL